MQYANGGYNIVFWGINSSVSSAYRYIRFNLSLTFLNLSEQ